MHIGETREPERQDESPCVGHNRLCLPRRGGGAPKLSFQGRASVKGCPLAARAGHAQPPAQRPSCIGTAEREPHRDGAPQPMQGGELVAETLNEGGPWQLPGPFTEHSVWGPAATWSCHPHVPRMWDCVPVPCLPRDHEGQRAGRLFIYLCRQRGEPRGQ